MSWLFFVLILSTLAIVCVAFAIYLRVRRHMKPAGGDENRLEDRRPAREA
ncbi:MAG: hypothetical protein JO249_21035 [Acidobacteria bacterium]|nr:hypothetical protein [Acidobacteriota bacterium]